jgi:hypothetical protein
MKLCSIEDCDRKVVARGWCGLHWQRWRRNGHPTETPPRKPRKDSVRHGSRRMYDLGCRCLKCAVANSRYSTAWHNGKKARVPAVEVRAHIEKLIASGWTKAEIARETGLERNTPWYITSGRSKSVNSKTAAAIFSLEPLTKEHRKLDSGPLTRFIRDSGKPIYGTFNDTEAKAFFRAEREGVITEAMADKLAIKALGLTIEEIYGDELWQEARA